MPRWLASNPASPLDQQSLEALFGQWRRFLLGLFLIPTVVTEQHMSQDHDNYWQAVLDVAEAIVAEMADNDEDQDEVLTRLVHEQTDQHDYVIRDDLQIHTLQYSQNPCAALFNGTLLGHRYQPGDNFPFAGFAADAFEADVTNKVKLLLGEED
jgi:hypothetical protein